MNAHQITVGIALILTIAGILRPQWPLIHIALILVCVDLLTR